MAAKKLSRAEAYFAEQHVSKLTHQQIAAELGVTAAAVRAHLKKARLPAATSTRTSFATHGGQDGSPLTISMTAEQSESDDKARESGQSGPSLYERFVVDPTKPAH